MGHRDCTGRSHRTHGQYACVVIRTVQAVPVSSHARVLREWGARTCWSPPAGRSSPGSSGRSQTAARHGGSSSMDDRFSRGTGSKDDEQQSPGGPSRRGRAGGWIGWNDSSPDASNSAAAVNALVPSTRGQTASAGASTSPRPPYPGRSSSETPLPSTPDSGSPLPHTLRPSSSHTLSLLAQPVLSPRPLLAGALSSSSSRQPSSLAHEIEFSSRVGMKPKGTEFSVRSPPPVPTFAMPGSAATESLVVRNAKGLEMQRSKTLQLSLVVP